VTSAASQAASLNCPSTVIADESVPARSVGVVSCASVVDAWNTADMARAAHRRRLNDGKGTL
jgi:hypothetical protein